jgi:predicted MFS family arabinose efflux permease
LLFSLLGSVAPARRATADAEARADYHLRLVEPFLFLAVFVEGLSASFLPVHLDQLARAASVSSGLVSLQFTTYFAAYALSLLPTAGQVERGRAKPILLAATALELASLVALAIATNPWLIFPIRAMAGLAQGMTLTGVQAYYFELLPQEHQTRGSALLGRNYNSALLSAAPIGALLAAYLGVGGTFVAAAGITLAVFVYAAILLPGLAQSRRPGPARGPSFRQSLREVVRDVGLLKGLLLVGIPAKALASGVTGFALPLLLVARSVPTEDVGQILMFYPVGIVLSSMLLARTAGRWGEPSRSLLLGTLGGGVGLVLVGLMSRDASVSTSIPAASILVVIVGLLVLGVAHGFVVGPIVAFVADSRTAGRIGRNPTSSVYRSLERIGHMSGPVVVGQLLILGHGSPTTILWLGVAAIVLGLLFRLGGASAPPVDSPVRVEVG